MCTTLDSYKILTWRSEGPGLVIIKVRIPSCEPLSGEKGVRHSASWPIKGISIIVVGLSEVDLNVCITSCHLVEVKWCDVTPDLQGVVHEGSNSVPAQQG